jgi:hypothetical protein
MMDGSAERRRGQTRNDWLVLSVSSATQSIIDVHMKSKQFVISMAHFLLYTRVLEAAPSEFKLV